MKLKTIFLSLGLFAATGAVAAPVQWAGNDHWYELVSTPLSFGDATAEAATRTYLGLGGHLVTVTSADENTFVHTLTTGGATWLGASDVAVEGEWRWVSGPEAGQLLTYTNWGPGEPNNSGNEDFAVYNNPWGGGLWNDRPDAGIAYIVEYSAPVPEPEIYAMLLAGLGIIGFAGRRLRNS
ncbi:putative secreted protein with PEP-CTERM sorting signal [Nitrosomonas oligotropha]|uniref:Putative secreted protein with PEP-CTERM sorting signal n=1 Tax=Nitrosomonas oligotropha TaxID=42354 RepID=A0A2T5HXG6_9PROT|nr:lectin-like protein [Nitrosomonas oligotropha]PTQ76272.1 putative secreted protein with PEP-CTERM sorting signal [Nitrosomonas oligotropha]